MGWKTSSHARTALTYALTTLILACGDAREAPDDSRAGDPGDAPVNTAPPLPDTTPARPDCDRLAEHFVENPRGAQAPPFSGTIFLSDAIITDTDPTSFLGIEYQGVGTRLMFDRRSERFEHMDAHLFDAQLGAERTVEIQVNPEFSREEAETECQRYLPAIGRLPAAFMRDVDTVWIHRGMHGFGGGNRNLLIHTGQGEDYIANGILEETLVHEATHTSIDDDHAQAADWEAAQTADAGFISEYAEDHPVREDLAETLLLYLAIRHRAGRMDPDVATTIRESIPNRTLYLDCLGLTMDVLP